MVISIEKNKSNGEWVTGMGGSQEGLVMREEGSQKTSLKEAFALKASCRQRSWPRVPGRSIFQGRTSAETAQEMPKLEQIEQEGSHRGCAQRASWSNHLCPL